MIDAKSMNASSESRRRKRNNTNADRSNLSQLNISAIPLSTSILQDRDANEKQRRPESHPR